MADKYNQKWVRVFNYCKDEDYAITLGQTTYFTCSSDKVGSSWKRHEDKHKEQYAKLGKFNFIVLYCWYHIKYGYDKNPFEIEAKKAGNIY